MVEITTFGLRDMTFGSTLMTFLIQLPNTGIVLMRYRPIYIKFAAQVGSRLQDNDQSKIHYTMCSTHSINGHWTTNIN